MDSSSCESPQAVPAAPVLPLHQFTRGDKLGEGAFSSVWAATHTRDDGSVQKSALKCVILHGERNEGFPLTALREVAALHELQARQRSVPVPSIVPIQGIAVGTQRQHVYLVTPEAEAGNLAAAMDRLGAPPLPLALDMIRQIFAAVAEVHAAGWMHRDIKPANILLHTDADLSSAWPAAALHLQLADFGLAKRCSAGVTKASPVSMGRPHTPGVITAWYRAPEVAVSPNFAVRAVYGPQVDTFAAATLAMELLTGMPLFPCKEDAALIRCQIEVLGPPPASLAHEWTRTADRAVAEALQPAFDSRAAHELRGAHGTEARARCLARLLASHAATRAVPHAVVAILAQCLAWDPYDRPHAAQVAESTAWSLLGGAS